MEVGLDSREDHDGTVSASASELALRKHARRETDGVVEGQTERLVYFLATFPAIEEVLLNIIPDSEERTACRVRRGVLTVGACYTLSDSGYE